ncbi:MAG: amidohydrolase family protein, partial [Methylococcales bacterium]
VVPATTALEMATINGAKALGIDHETGSLSISKAADVTAIDLSQLETQPVYEAISQIVYAASRQQVSDVWVAGKQLLKQGQLTLMDTAELKANISEWQKRLKTI